MRHFWNWVKNDDETRTLYLEGVIAEESWFADDVTRRLHRGQSDLHHAHGLSP